MKTIKIILIVLIYVFTYISFFWFIPQFLNNILNGDKNSLMILFQATCVIGFFTGHYIAEWICKLVHLFKNEKKPFKLYIKK